MNEFIKYLAGVFFIVILSGCPEDLHDDFIVNINVCNNSNFSILYIEHYVSKQNNNDTLLPIEASTWWGENNIVDPKDCKQKRIGERLKDAIDNSSNLLIFFLDQDTVGQVSWERIRDENIILKKVYFETWEDLEACNFTITYP